MKKFLISAAAAAALVTGLVLGLHSMRNLDPILEANVEALTRNEGGGGYDCPGACLTWAGSTGGGIDCMCHRYAGRCKRWCD